MGSCSAAELLSASPGPCPCLCRTSQSLFNTGPVRTVPHPANWHCSLGQHKHLLQPTNPLIMGSISQPQTSERPPYLRHSIFHISEISPLTLFGGNSVWTTLLSGLVSGQCLSVPVWVTVPCGTGSDSDSADIVVRMVDPALVCIETHCEMIFRQIDTYLDCFSRHLEASSLQGKKHWE